MKNLSIFLLSLATAVLWISSAFAVNSDNQLTVDGSASGSQMTFGSATTNATALQTNGEGSFSSQAYTTSVTVTWTHQTAPGQDPTALTLTMKPQAANLTGTGGGVGTKPIGDVYFSTDQSNWIQLVNGTTHTVKTSLANPNGQATQSLTVYFRIKLSYDNQLSADTGSWVLSGGGAGSNLLWNIS